MSTRYRGEPGNTFIEPQVHEALKNPLAGLYFAPKSIPTSKLMEDFADGVIPYSALTVGAGDIPYSALTVAAGDIPPTAIDTLPRAAARRSTNQTINNNTITAISFDTEVADTDTMFAATSTRITCVTAGLYLTNAQTSWSLAGTVTTRMVAAIRLTPIDGSGAVTIADDERTSSTTEGIQQNITRVIPMVAGDYIELVVFQTNAAVATRTVAATSPYSPLLSATRIGAA